MSDVIKPDDFSDLRFNPFDEEYSPKYFGQGSIPAERRTIPETSPYFIKLFEMPVSDDPSTVEITIVSTSSLMTEVEKTVTPASGQYRVNYDQPCPGIIEFNSDQAGLEVDIKYKGLGTLVQKSIITTFFSNAGIKMGPATFAPSPIDWKDRSSYQAIPGAGSYTFLDARGRNNEFVIADSTSNLIYVFRYDKSTDTFTQVGNSFSQPVASAYQSVRWLNDSQVVNVAGGWIYLLDWDGTDFTVAFSLQYATGTVLANTCAVLNSIDIYVQEYIGGAGWYGRVLRWNGSAFTQISNTLDMTLSGNGIGTCAVVQYGIIAACMDSNNRYLHTLSWNGTDTLAIIHTIDFGLSTANKVSTLTRDGKILRSYANYKAILRWRGPDLGYSVVGSTSDDYSSGAECTLLDDKTCMIQGAAGAMSNYPIVLGFEAI